ncbi:MAG: GNAT family N-acetyltransferase [Thermoleophilaceae bacterium]
MGSSTRRTRKSAGSTTGRPGAGATRPRALRAAVRFMLEEIGRPEVISIAHPDNAASRRVMEKAGLSYAGARHWKARDIDVVWYSTSAAA